MNYSSLKSGGDQKSVFEWAKRLTGDLNRRDAVLDRSIGKAGMAVLWRSGLAVPEGWVAENGVAYATTAYPDLFAVIGYNYGGAGAVFNVPNNAGYIIKT